MKSCTKDSWCYDSIWVAIKGMLDAPSNVLMPVVLFDGIDQGFSTYLAKVLQYNLKMLKE